MKKVAKQLPESPLFWPARFRGKNLEVLDETLIPARLKYIKVRTVSDAVGLIRTMKTRAFGQFLVVLNAFLLTIEQGRLKEARDLLKDIQETARALNASRPTFPFAEVTSIVVGWAQRAVAEDLDLRDYLMRNINGYLQGIRHRRLERVGKIASLMADGDSVLTHCNVSGELAMAAVLCRQKGKSVNFFVTETRPYFQGAKLTAWELKRVGAQVTLIADNAVATVMADGLINKVIVGSDRSAANGDFANKIGTYQIAVLCKEFGIPFYVLTQPSDKVARGSDIPVEIRDSQELLTFGGRRIVQDAVDGFYPGFDVVPHGLISAAIAINTN